MLNETAPQINADIRTDKEDLDGNSDESVSSKQTVSADSAKYKVNLYHNKYFRLNFYLFGNVSCAIFSKKSPASTNGDDMQVSKVTSSCLELPPQYSVEKSKSGSNISERTKRKSWYNSFIYPSYKSRSETFHKLFKEVPEDERLIVGMFLTFEMNDSF